MAAKEYTEKMFNNSAQDPPTKDMRRSLNSLENTNTDGVKSLVEKQVYNEGTFAETGEVGRIYKETIDPLHDPYLEPEEVLPKQSLGSVSFGAQNH